MVVSFHMSGKTASARGRLNRVASESDMEAPASFSNSCVTRSGPQLFPDGRCASFDNTESGVMGSNWNPTVPTRGEEDGMAATDEEAEYCFENCLFRIDACSEGEVITVPLTESAGSWHEVDHPQAFLANFHQR